MFLCCSPSTRSLLEAVPLYDGGRPIQVRIIHRACYLRWQGKLPNTYDGMCFQQIAWP